MHEFDTVSSSSATDLARSLTQRSSDGWEVVSIVGSGLEMTAFLRRVRGSATTTATSAASVGSQYATPASTAVDEPAGWGSSPSAASGTEWGAGTSATTPEPAAVSNAASPTAAASMPTSASPSSTVPQVPAGWYADPAGRYELRYWDGAQWTEHVARGGTQYTDPPVA